MNQPIWKGATITPEAQEELPRWEADWLKLAEQFKAIPLRVLVWGIGEGFIISMAAKVDLTPAEQHKLSVALKRKQIRDELAAQGFLALFSEEWRLIDTGLSQKTNELLQALSAHIIIILIEESPGALAEMHDFASHDEVARKMFVLCPEEYGDGYSAQGVGSLLSRGYGNFYLYKKDEIDSCNVLTRALDRANARREVIAYKMLRSTVQ